MHITLRIYTSAFIQFLRSQTVVVFSVKRAPGSKVFMGLELIVPSLSVYFHQKVFFAEMKNVLIVSVSLKSW